MDCRPPVSPSRHPTLPHIMPPYHASFAQIGMPSAASAGSSDLGQPQQHSHRRRSLVRNSPLSSGFAVHLPVLCYSLCLWYRLPSTVVASTSHTSVAPRDLPPLGSRRRVAVIPRVGIGCKMWNPHTHHIAGRLCVAVPRQDHGIDSCAGQPRVGIGCKMWNPHTHLCHRSAMRGSAKAGPRD
ncbi:hypothetical protein BC831DRAFT_242026 [Entophlyctis helioformis]|nr:hypothetical protein BC831DRAFT_242026 [Entophlyctis helioformis]